MDLDPDVKRMAHEVWVAFCDKMAEIEQRQLDQITESFRDFMDDLINNPLVRPWRESLDMFQEHHWRQDGMRLTAQSYAKVAQLIERLVSNPRCFAHGPIRPELQPAVLPPGVVQLAMPVTASAMAGSRQRPHPGRIFFDNKVEVAKRCLEAMRVCLVALGNRLDSAGINKLVDVDADATAIEELIWRYNDALESARDAWLSYNLPGDLNSQLIALHTPLALGLPWFTDDEQAARSINQGLRISERLGSRDTAVGWLIVGMEALENAGTLAGFLLGGGAVASVIRTGGKWGVVKFLASTAAVATADRIISAGLRAGGASDQQVQGARFAAAVVSYIILRRRSMANAPATKTIPSPPVTPPRHLLSRKRRAQGNAFNEERKNAYPYREIPIAREGRGRPFFLDGYNPSTGEIVFRRDTQFSEIPLARAREYMREFTSKYPPGSKIAKVPSAKGLAGKTLEGTMFFEVRPQWKAIPKAVLRDASSRNIIIRDTNGKIYNAN